MAAGMKANSRRLVLVRHAKSAWPEGVPDHDRPLGARGRRDAPAAGRWLRQADCVPDRVLCSTARRARETWELAERELGARAPVTFERGIYEASAAGLLDLIRRLPPGAETVAVVGHDPAIPDLALALTASGVHPGNTTGGSTLVAALDRIREKFPTAAVAVLEVRGPWSGLSAGHSALLDFVTPRDFVAGRTRSRPR
jgi:phosphohistidine phosphatase